MQKSAKITKTRLGVHGVVFPKIVENNLFYQGLQNQHKLQKRRRVYGLRGVVFLKVAGNNLDYQYLSKSAQISKTMPSVSGVVLKKKMVEHNLFHQSLQKSEQI